MNEEWTTIVAEVLELNGKLERMMDGIEVVKEKQDEVARDVTKIREAVYNPDEGIYARIRELENWKDSATKIIWITATAMVGLGAATVWNQIISGG
jgi:hypothetical protein